MKKARKSYLDSASEILQKLLKGKKSPISSGFTRWRLWQEWDKVVGPTLSAHTKPAGYYNGALYVWVDSAPRMQECIFIKDTIKEMINVHLGKKYVNYIRFTIKDSDIPESAKFGLEKLIKDTNKDAEEKDSR